MKNSEGKDVIRGTVLTSPKGPTVVCTGFSNDTGNCLLQQIAVGNSVCPEQSLDLTKETLSESSWLVTGFRDLDDRPVGVPRG